MWHTAEPNAVLDTVYRCADIGRTPSPGALSMN